jgi:hypothetical protein
VQTRVGADAINLFDFRSGTWTAGVPMNAGRWYPTAAALANGEVAIVGGAIDAASLNVLPQVRTIDGRWRDSRPRCSAFQHRHQSIPGCLWRRTIGCSTPDLMQAHTIWTRRAQFMDARSSQQPWRSRLWISCDVRPRQSADSRRRGSTNRYGGDHRSHVAGARMALCRIDGRCSPRPHGHRLAGWQRSRRWWNKRP